MSARVTARHAGPAFVQHRQLTVFGPEIVAPLAHAMCFVDGEQAQGAVRVQRVQQAQKARRAHALGRGVQQRQLACQQLTLDVLRLLPVECGIEESRGHARLVQRAHLVVHQRDQGRNHQRHAQPGALAGYGRNLVTKRLAAARGHQHQRVAAGDGVVDHTLLLAAKGVVAEHLAQDGRGRRCG